MTGVPTARLKGAGLAAASSVASGASLVSMRTVAPYADNQSLALFCTAFGFGVLMPILLANRRWPAKKDQAVLFVLGFFVSGFSAWLLLEGVARTSAAMAGVVLSVNPLITLLFAVIARQETFSTNRCIGASIACLGVLISMAGETERSFGVSAAWIVGVLAILLATSIGAVYNVGYRTMLQRVDPLIATGLSMAGGLTFLILLALITAKPPLVTGIPVGIWVVMAFCGVVGGVIKLLLWTMALKYTDASRVAVFITFVPVVAATLELAFFGRSITLYQGRRLCVGHRRDFHRRPVPSGRDVPSAPASAAFDDPAVTNRAQRGAAAVRGATPSAQ